MHGFQMESSGRQKPKTRGSVWDKIGKYFVITDRDKLFKWELLLLLCVLYLAFEIPFDQTFLYYHASFD